MKEYPPFRYQKLENMKAEDVISRFASSRAEKQSFENQNYEENYDEPYFQFYTPNSKYNKKFSSEKKTFQLRK